MSEAQHQGDQILTVTRVGRARALHNSRRSEQHDKFES